MDFISPQKIIKAFQEQTSVLSPGAVVVDFGVGSGAYATLLAPLLGDTGLLYVVDVHKDLLKRLRDDIYSPVLRPVWADIERPLSSGLPSESTDCVLFSNVLFQLEKKDVAIEEGYRILKKGGVFLVIDWDGETQTSLVKKELTTEVSSLKQLFTEKGFVLQSDIEAGAHHFAFIGIKK